MRERHNHVGTCGAQLGCRLVGGLRAVRERDVRHVGRSRRAVEVLIDNAEHAHGDAAPGQVALVVGQCDLTQQVRGLEQRRARLGILHVGGEHRETRIGVDLRQARRPVTPIVIAGRRRVVARGIHELSNRVALARGGERSAVERVTRVQDEVGAHVLGQRRHGAERVGRLAVRALHAVMPVDVVGVQDLHRSVVGQVGSTTKHLDLGISVR